jgi:hypothetical protein
MRESGSDKEIWDQQEKRLDNPSNNNRFCILDVILVYRGRRCIEGFGIGISKTIFRRKRSGGGIGIL